MSLNNDEKQNLGGVNANDRFLTFARIPPFEPNFSFLIFSESQKKSSFSFSNLLGPGGGGGRRGRGGRRGGGGGGRGERGGSTAAAGVLFFVFFYGGYNQAPIVSLVYGR